MRMAVTQAMAARKKTAHIALTARGSKA